MSDASRRFAHVYVHADSDGSDRMGHSLRCIKSDEQQALDEARRILWETEAWQNGTHVTIWQARVGRAIEFGYLERRVTKRASITTAEILAESLAAFVAS